MSIDRWTDRQLPISFARISIYIYLFKILQVGLIAPKGTGKKPMKTSEPGKERVAETQWTGQSARIDGTAPRKKGGSRGPHSGTRGHTDQ
jgi:hypothetical protein